MPILSIIATSSRTATLLIAPPGTRYGLAAPMAWQVTGADGSVAAAGVATVAPLFVEGLEPDRNYVLEVAGEALAFRTRACAGLVHATDFGADPTAADNAAALARAIAAVPEGGTLLIPPGRYVTGPIFLKPRVTLYLPDRTELAARADRAGWPLLPERDEHGRVVGTWEGLPETSFAAPVTAVGCEDVTLTGRGTIDGGGDRGDWWQWPKETRDGARRPRTVFLAHCRNAQITGLTVRNSPSWTVHPYRCDGLVAAALKIENPADSPNTDGLNPECCEDVRLIGLSFSVGDDCIAVKAGKRARGQTEHLAPTRRLAIRHCRMARGHGAVVLGSEMSGDITDVEITGCEFVGTDRGLRIKTRRGRGGCVARVRMRDVMMDGVMTPLAINAFYFCDPDGKSTAVQSRDPASVDETTPQISDILLEDVVAENVHNACVAVLGLPEAPVSGVRLERVRFGFAPGAEAGVPLMACGIAPVRHASVLARFADITTDLEIKPVPEETETC
ncbi:glycoside hydrolase family 28 protein [Algicella marina]|uniref:Glycoside hydrolase family 28 protein n=2 Tax=Algicella marina TaxID=2683284 RepID=A0A6P1T3H2_9RHOB|nr:glycoside hydrolase family 28 protein [Algicella marina]